MNIFYRSSVSSSSQYIIRAVKERFNGALNKVQVSKFFKGRKVAYYSSSTKSEFKPQLTGTPTGIDPFNLEKSAAKLKYLQKQFALSKESQSDISHLNLNNLVSKYVSEWNQSRA